MSGYAESAITHRGELEEGLVFLQKPFGLDVLVQERIIRNLLEIRSRIKSSILLITHDISVIAESLYYSWSKEFLEAGKKRLAGDTARQATSNEVKALRGEARDLKEALAEQMLENRLLKKSMTGHGDEQE